MSSQTNLLDRYQAYRVRRHLANEAQYQHYLPSWRTRSRRRLLASVLVAGLAYMMAASVFILFGPEWSPLLWIPGAALMSVAWTVMQIVSGRRSDAPADALDEWELARRNSARSIGFAVTQAIVTVPAVALILTTTYTDDPRLALGGGFVVLTAVLIGTCTPGIILAWTAPEDDPEDTATAPEEETA